MGIPIQAPARVAGLGVRAGAIDGLKAFLNESGQGAVGRERDGVGVLEQRLRSLRRSRGAKAKK
eukprot:scaffold7608_cov90-Isochrysis_galbana.AAC.1